MRLARTEGVGSVEAQNDRYPDAAKGQARHIGKRARRLAGPDIEFVIWLKSLILRAQSLILPSDSLILSQGPLILTTAVLISRPAAARSSASSLPLSPWAHVMHDGLGPAWHAWRATMIVIAASTVDGDGGGIHQLIFLAYPDLQRLGTFGEAKAPKNNPPILHVPTLVIAELAWVMITWRSSHRVSTPHRIARIRRASVHHRLWPALGGRVAGDEAEAWPRRPVHRNVTPTQGMSHVSRFDLRILRTADRRHSSLVTLAVFLVR